MLGGGEVAGGDVGPRAQAGGGFNVDQHLSEQELVCEPQLAGGRPVSSSRWVPGMEESRSRGRGHRYPSRSWWRTGAAGSQRLGLRGGGTWSLQPPQYPFPVQEQGRSRIWRPCRICRETSRSPASPWPSSSSRLAVWVRRRSAGGQ